MSEVIIETKNLARSYVTYKKTEGLLNSFRGFFHREYTEKIALRPTDLKIHKGEVVGLVGSNGAGKTTLIKLLAGLIYPSGGNVKVLGFDPWDRKSEYLKRISVLLGQKAQLWWDLAPVDSFQLLATIYDLPKVEARTRYEELAEVLRCQDQLNVQLRRLSLGERMKMEIIGSLLHRPEVLFLDEPTIGLDIVAQNTIREFIQQYVDKYQPTIILTSHYMNDISALATRLLLISQGALVYDGTVKEFASRAESKQKLTVKLASPLTRALVLPEFTIPESQTQVLELEIPAKRLGDVLSQLSVFNQITELKIEEAGFEDVVHEFLSKDVRGSKASDTRPV